MRYAQWRQDAIELLFQEFVEKLNTDELGIDYKELFFQTIETSLPSTVIQWFEKYKLPYKEKTKGKHSFMRKDLFLYWCGVFCDRILPAKTEELLEALKEICFDDWNTSSELNRLLFYISYIIGAQQEAYIYIYDWEVIRFSFPSEHLARWLQEEKYEYWCIQLKLFDIVYLAFSGESAPSTMKDDFFNLSRQEMEVVANIKVPQYQQDKMTISFNKENTPKEIRIDWKESNLNRYSELSESIQHWEIGHKKYQGKKVYIKISETKNLENKEEK